MKSINIELNEKDYERLKSIAVNEHRTIKATVTMVVLEYMEQFNNENKQ
jgi:hypothetical protein